MGYYSDKNFCPEMSVGYLVRRIHQLGTIVLEPIFEAHGLSHAQWSTLVVIYLGRAATPAQIAREVGYDKGAMTRLIDDLETRGLLTRARCGEDRRVVRLTLTPKGEALGLECKKEVLAAWNAWLGDWDTSEIDRFVTDLNRLKTRLDSLAEMEPAE